MEIGRIGLVALLSVTAACAPLQVIPDGVYLRPSGEITVDGRSYHVPAHTLVIAPLHRVQQEAQDRIRKYQKIYGKSSFPVPRCFAENFANLPDGRAARSLSLKDCNNGFYDSEEGEIWCTGHDAKCIQEETEHMLGILDEHHRRQ